MLELKEAIIKIAREHPKLGIGNLQVPSFLMLIKEALEKLGRERHFLTWDEYKRVCQEIGILISCFCQSEKVFEVSEVSARVAIVVSGESGERESGESGESGER